MRRFLFLLCVLIFSLLRVDAQSVADSTAATLQRDSIPSRVSQDTAAAVKDSAVAPAEEILPARSPRIIGAWDTVASVPLYIQALNHHPYLNFRTRPVIIPSNIKVFHGKETFFYVCSALVLTFALLRIAFAKYFSDLFRVFFRTTMKQRQIREQLMQNPLPSLFFNFFFVATGGMYLAFLLFHFQFILVPNFWLLFLYCSAALCVIYMGKFIGLKICGWMFNMKNGAESYIFIVFIINKVIGIFLLPFLVLLAFSPEPLRSVAMVVSWVGLGILYLYRFILGYSTVRNEVRFNLFHFFLYLCAFEIAPLLLIYRLLLFFFK